MGSKENRRSPYGTDFSTAMNGLSSPIEYNAVEQVNIPWNKYVGGPRLMAPQFEKTGFGIEYRLGGFGLKNWGEWFKAWWNFLTE